MGSQGTCALACTDMRDVVFTKKVRTILHIRAFSKETAKFFAFAAFLLEDPFVVY